MPCKYYLVLINNQRSIIISKKLAKVFWSIVFITVYLIPPPHRNIYRDNFIGPSGTLSFHLLHLFSHFCGGNKGQNSLEFVWFFHIENVFLEQLHSIKNMLIYKVNCDLKLPENYYLTHALYFNFNWKKGFCSLSSFLYRLLKTKLFKKCVICSFII